MGAQESRSQRLLAGTASLFGMVEIRAIALPILVILWRVRRTIIQPMGVLPQMADNISNGS